MKEESSVLHIAAEQPGRTTENVYRGLRAGSSLKHAGHHLIIYGANG